jgi:hypothetical protein
LALPNLTSIFGFSANTLDSSWRWFLGYAFSSNFQWGTKVIFTYGPLGFLDNSYFYSNHTLWFLSAFANILVRVLFSLIFAYFAYSYTLKTDNKHGVISYIFLILLVFITINVTIILPISTLLYLIATLIIVDVFNNDFESMNIKLSIRSAISGFLMAFGSLIKFNIMPFSIIILCIYPLLCIYNCNKKRVLFESFFGLVFFAITFLMLYMLIGQNLFNLSALLRGIYEIIIGYTSSMFIYGNHFQNIVAIIILFYFIFLLFKAYKNKQKRLFSQLLLLMLVLFFSFKEGFVRQDPGMVGGHALLFFSISLILIVFTILIYSRLKLPNNFINIILFLLVFYFNVVGGSVHLNLYRPFNNLKTLVELVFKSDKRNELQKISDSYIRNRFKIESPILQSIKNKTVTIIPCDLMMAQGYNFKFIPQIIPQAYSAYTPYLDEQNAKQLCDSSAPQKIIYTFEDIDGRYPLFTEPYTFMTILSCYKTEIPGNRYTLFTRKNSCQNLNLTSISSIKSELNQWVDLPSNADFMDINISPTFLSHIIDVFYKPLSYIYISFKLSDNTIAGPYRFIPMVSKDHLFVKYFIRNQNDLNDLMSGNAYNLLKIQSFKITTKRRYGINLDYDNSFSTIFYSSDAKFKDITFLIQKTHLLNQNTNYELESITLNNNKSLYNLAQNPTQPTEITVTKSNKDDFIQISGWAVDSITKNEDKGVIAVIDNKYFYPFQTGNQRSDVSKAFNNTNYEYSGFIGSIPLNELGSGKHTLILRIINYDETGYYESKPIELNIEK